MKYRIWITLLSFLYLYLPKTHGRDTLLVSMRAEPFFYNVISNHDGSIFAGTSNGIFEIEGVELKKYSEEKGYITIAEVKKIVINKDGIKNYENRKLNYLLPYPELGREEYHAETNEFLYIVSSGALYIFKFTYYDQSFPYQSIRTISKNWIGSYSGIYYKGRKIPDHKYCDGYIREYNQKAFVCYNSLEVFQMPVFPSDSLVKLSIPCLTISGKQYVYDVLYAQKHKTYFIATKGELIEIDENLENCKTIFTAPDQEIVIIGEYRAGIYFSSGQYFLFKNFTLPKIDTLIKLDAPIISGVLTKLNYFLLTSDGLHTIHSDGQHKKLAKLQKAHTMLEISPTELVISTDQGLYLYNLADNSVSTLIAGIEFNRRGLYKENETIYAGSINGLYSFDIKDIRSMIGSNLISLPGNSAKSPYLFILLLLIVLLLVAGIIIIMSLRKKLSQKQMLPEKTESIEVTREEIEAYIKENLAIASIHSIVEHFNTNTSYVYALLEPDKPGSIIQNLRMQMIADMKKNKVKVADIALATGLSESYIRKLKVL